MFYFISFSYSENRERGHVSHSLLTAGKIPERQLVPHILFLQNGQKSPISYRFQTQHPITYTKTKLLMISIRKGYGQPPPSQLPSTKQ